MFSFENLSIIDYTMFYEMWLRKNQKQKKTEDLDFLNFKI